MKGKAGQLAYWTGASWRGTLEPPVKGQLAWIVGPDIGTGKVRLAWEVGGAKFQGAAVYWAEADYELASPDQEAAVRLGGAPPKAGT